MDWCIILVRITNLLSPTPVWHTNKEPPLCSNAPALQSPSFIFTSKVPYSPIPCSLTNTVLPEASKFRPCTPWYSTKTSRCNTCFGYHIWCPNFQRIHHTWCQSWWHSPARTCRCSTPNTTSRRQCRPGCFQRQRQLPCSLRGCTRNAQCSTCRACRRTSGQSSACIREQVWMRCRRGNLHYRLANLGKTFQFRQ